MNLQFLDNSGLDNKYYQWKELIIHSLLEPVLTKVDNNHKFDIYMALETAKLTEKYGKELLGRMDKNYNNLLLSKRLFFVRLINKNDIELIKNDGFFNDAVFSVFKDDLLKANPLTLTHFEFLDPLTLAKVNYN